MQYRKLPPRRKSTERKGVVKSFRPHHCFISFGSVQACQTRSREASKIRVMTSSFFDPRWMPSPFFVRRARVSRSISRSRPRAREPCFPCFISCTNSAKRSIVSRAPSSMPDATIPLRSSTVEEGFLGDLRLLADLFEHGALDQNVPWHSLKLESVDNPLRRDDLPVLAMEAVLVPLVVTLKEPPGTSGSYVHFLNGRRVLLRTPPSRDQFRIRPCSPHELARGIEDVRCHDLSV